MGEAGAVWCKGCSSSENLFYIRDTAIRTADIFGFISTVAAESAPSLPDLSNRDFDDALGCSGLGGGETT